MNFWWVNQNQTFKHEVGGGYMWSPKRNRDGARSQYYENMKVVAPGDLVFSFVNTKISTLGIVTSYCEEAQRPTEFGKTGNQWEAAGWKVLVEYHHAGPPIKPADHMSVLGPTLPTKYSPIRPDGGGNQVYLAQVPEAMARALLGLMGSHAEKLILRASSHTGRPDDQPSASVEREQQEREIERRIRNDTSIPETTRKALVNARIGQGLFRENLRAVENRCRLTDVANTAHLIASHIKPWRHSNNNERLDGNNGLLLTPTVDHLFDKGFISFEDDGTLLISPVADFDALGGMHIPKTANVGGFNVAQRVYLKHHRLEIFKSSEAED